MHRLERHTPAKLALLTAACALGLVMSAPTLAQSTPTTAPAAGATSSVISWTNLTNAQKTALAPLETSWETLAEGHQRKWIALSQNFARMSAQDQATLHSRMADWATLKPKERQQARLNFAETKKTPLSERAANWEVYQALPPDQKETLAKTAAGKRAGAAIAAKAPPPERMTPVPLTRNAPDVQREKRVAQQPLDPHTLLPLTLPPKATQAN